MCAASHDFAGKVIYEGSTRYLRRGKQRFIHCSVKSCMGREIDERPVRTIDFPAHIRDDHGRYQYGIFSYPAITRILAILLEKLIFSKYTRDDRRTICICSASSKEGTSKEEA